MENHPMKGHNRPPIALRAEDLKTELSGQYLTLKKELAALETDFHALPQPEAINSDEIAAEVNAWIQRAKKFGRDISNSHNAEKEEFKILGKAVDDFFFRGFRDPNEDNVKAAENKLRPWSLAKARAAEEKARLIREEAERKAAEERAKEAARQAEAERLEAVAREQATALRETENLADADEAAKALLEAEANKLHRAQLDEEERLNAAKEQNKMAAQARAAEKEKPKGVTTKTHFEPINCDWDKIRAGLGALGPHFLQGNIEDALLRLGKCFTGDQAPPAIDGVTWHQATTTSVRATRG